MLWLMYYPYLLEEKKLKAMDGEVDEDSRIRRVWYEEVKESYGNDQ